MRPLSASELLQVWEQGVDQPPVVQAVSLLSAACPDTPEEALAQIAIGKRDAQLLMLRERMFGSHIVGLAVCPGCGERIEFTTDTGTIRLPNQPPPESLSCSMDGCEVRFRLPNSADLIFISALEKEKELMIRLLERCVITAKSKDNEIAVQDLPKKVIDAVAQEMDAADPQTDVELSLSCPSCCHEWQAAFDIVSFFWSEISAWAQTALHDVHRLASVYGWREEDILALSPWRRHLYVNMVSG